MADELLTTIRAEIDERMNELRPLLAEYEGLLAAAEVLVAQGAREIPGARSARARSVAGRGTRRASGRSGTSTGSGRSSSSRATRASSATRASTAKRSSAGFGGRAGARARSGAGRPRGPLSASAKAILAALEHGSHTAAELVMVTALNDAEVRESIRKLIAREAVSRISRDGKPAYALAQST